MPPSTTDTRRPPAPVRVSPRFDGRNSIAPDTSVVRELGFTKIEPNLPPRGGIQLVHPLRCLDMQQAQHVAQAGSIIGIGRRVGDEMVMIG